MVICEYIIKVSPQGCLKDHFPSTQKATQACFSKVQKLLGPFRVSQFPIFATPSFYALRICNLLGFSYFKTC